MLIEVEVDLRKVSYVGSTCIVIDIQRIARAIIRTIGHAAATIDDTVDLSRIVTFSIAEIDRIPRRISAGRASAVDVLHSAARDGDRVTRGVTAPRMAAVDILYRSARNNDTIAFYLAGTVRKATVDSLSECRRGAALNDRRVADHISVRPVPCNAAIDIAVCAASLEDCRIALDKPRAAHVCHATRHIIVEMVAAEFGIVVLDTAAATRHAAVHGFDRGCKQCTCLIDKDFIPRHISTAERNAAKQELIIGKGASVERQRIVRNIATVRHMPDHARRRPDHNAAVRVNDIIRRHLRAANLRTLPRHIRRRHIWCRRKESGAAERDRNEQCQTM